MTGHVATTRVIAQMIAGMNGYRIQRLPRNSPATDITASVV
jgi:hypothetical protein